MKQINWCIVDIIHLDIEDLNFYFNENKEIFIEEKIITELKYDKNFGFGYKINKRRKLEQLLNKYIIDNGLVLGKIKITDNKTYFGISDVLGLDYEKMIGKEIIYKNYYDKRKNIKTNITKEDITMIDNLRNIYFIDLFKIEKNKKNIYNKKDIILFNLIYEIYNDFEKKGGSLFYTNYFLNNINYFNYLLNKGLSKENIIEEFNKWDDLALNIDFINPITIGEKRLKGKIINIIKKTYD